MLPNRLNIFRSTEDELKRLKQKTGLTPNVAARIAFAISLKDGFVYERNDDEINPDGTLNLDKLTWFGDHLELYELLLKKSYPNLNGKELEQAWAAHVRAGTPALRNRPLLSIP